MQKYFSNNFPLIQITIVRYKRWFHHEFIEILKNPYDQLNKNKNKLKSTQFRWASPRTSQFVLSPNQINFNWCKQKHVRNQHRLDLEILAAGTYKVGFCNDWFKIHGEALSLALHIYDKFIEIQMNKGYFCLLCDVIDNVKFFRFNARPTFLLALRIYYYTFNSLFILSSHLSYNLLIFNDIQCFSFHFWLDKYDFSVVKMKLSHRVNSFW